MDISRPSLRLIHVPGYGPLAVLPGEDVAEIVDAAEAVLDEKEACPWLGEVDMGDMMTYEQILATLPPQCAKTWSEEHEDYMPSCAPENRCREYYDALAVDVADEAGASKQAVLAWLIANPDALEEGVSDLVEMFMEAED